MPTLSRRTFLVLAATAAATSRARAAAPAELVGLNFSFLDVDRSRVSACRERGRGHSVYGQGFLTRYREAAVRDRVKAILARLREERVTAIRHNLWFIDDDRAPRDVFAVRQPGLAEDMTGLFIDDMRAAGLRSLLLSMSPVGQSLPGCRKVQWGDCFRPATVDSTMRFVTGVAKAAARQLGQDLYMDPCNEGVPSNAVRPPLRASMTDFLEAGVRTLAALRPAPRIAISTQANRADERLAIVGRILDATRVRLDLLDIHIYGDTRTRPDAATLTRFRDFARGRGASLLVGEIQADPGTIGYARSVLRKGDAADPIGYFPWPLGNPATGCHADMNVIDLLGTLSRSRD